MMSEQRPRTTRRFQTPHSTRKKGEHDPCYFVLTVQLALCTLLVILSFAAADAKPAFLPELAARYQELISARQVFLPAETMQTAAQYYTRLRDDTADAAANFITELIKPETAPAPEPPSESAAADAPENALTGSGGWMGLGDGDGRAAPSSCDLSPIVFSAWLEPPISGKVTSTFGYRAHPITESDDFHRGVDIAALEGTKIYAPLPGVVLETDTSAIYGNFITLDHGNGLMTTYCHCETIVAQTGENLRKGELLATVGSTGISTGPHVHFEIHKNGKYYNPAWVLEGMSSDGI